MRKDKGALTPMMPSKPSAAPASKIKAASSASTAALSNNIVSDVISNSSGVSFNMENNQVIPIENIVSENESKWRYLVIFVFGLIHGLGFANALRDIGLPEDHFLSSLLFFNLGVELGQVTIILMLYFLISKWFSEKQWYQKRIVYPVSTMIACIALYWTIERVILN